MAEDTESTTEASDETSPLLVRESSVESVKSTGSRGSVSRNPADNEPQSLSTAAIWGVLSTLMLGMLLTLFVLPGGVTLTDFPPHRCLHLID